MRITTPVKLVRRRFDIVFTILTAARVPSRLLMACFVTKSREATPGADRPLEWHNAFGMPQCLCPLQTLPGACIRREGLLAPFPAPAKCLDFGQAQANPASN